MLESDETIVSVLEIAPAEADLCNGARGPCEVLGTDQLHRIIQPATVNQQIKVIENNILVWKNTMIMGFRLWVRSCKLLDFYTFILLFILKS